MEYEELSKVKTESAQAASFRVPGARQEFQACVRHDSVMADMQVMIFSSVVNP
jgi:hypothetical protein